MPISETILTQRVVNLLGKLSVIESLVPQVKDLSLRSQFSKEVVELKVLVNQLRS